MVDIKSFAIALGGKPNTGRGYIAHCPAHDDRRPRLSIDLGDDGKILLRCHAGCSQAAVINALAAQGLWSANSPLTLSEQFLKEKNLVEEKKAEAAKKHERAAYIADQVLEIAGPAREDHPYLVRKQVAPAPRLREISLGRLVNILQYHPQANDTPLVEGRILVVPIEIDGDTSSIEMIDENGLKTALAGGRKSGGCWIPAALPGGTGETLKLLIGEGVATCLSALGATGHSTVAALSCSNLQAVAAQMRARYPQAEIIILADLMKSTGEPDHHAAEASRVISGKLAVPDFGPDRPEGMTDFNDLAAMRGVEVVRACIDSAFFPAPPLKKSPTHYSANALSCLAVGQETTGEANTIVVLEPLPDELLPVAKFDYALLPGALRTWIKDIAERMNCPPDFVAVAAMVSLAAVLGRKVGIRPQSKTDWTIVPNLWGLVVGRPGAMKSPSLEAGKAPLRRLVTKAKKVYQLAMKEHLQQQEVEEMRAGERKKAMKKKIAEDPDADLTDLIDASVEIPPPIERRYESMDPTPEALCELLRLNCNGLLVFRDEMVSLLKSLDRPENAEGRGLYLTGWNGDSSFTVDRIGRGFNLDVEAICLSLLGGTQPGKIAEYINQAIKGGTGDDGLIQRFGMLVWPDDTERWKDVDRYPDAAAKNKAFAVFEALDQLDLGEIGAESDKFEGREDGIPYLRFSPEAQEVFLQWRDDLENNKLRGDNHPAIISHLSKYRKLVPALALLCHLADGGKGPVAIAPTLQSLAWAEYLETHARRAYGAVSRPAVTTAKVIKKRIANGDLQEEFSARDIYRSGWTQLSDRNAVEDGLRMLVEYGHLLESRKEGSAQGGRPSVVYHVNRGGVA